MNRSIQPIPNNGTQRVQVLPLPKEYPTFFGITPDLWIFLVLLTVSNTHLVTGKVFAFLIFYPDNFVNGEWWRFFSYSFVHWSWYHLLLDAGAFFLLYTGLEEKRISRKIFCLFVCCACSLTAVGLTSPLIDSLGLCGLSGIGHGLMAFSSLEMIRNDEKEIFRIGVAGFILVVSKSIYESITGDVFFHLGLCGTPLSVCHAGGVIGGILAFFLFTKMENCCYKDACILNV